MARIDAPNNGLERVPNFGMERGMLAMQNQRESLQRWRAVPIVMHDANVDHMYGKDMLDRLKGFHMQAGPVLDAVERDLMPALVKWENEHTIERRQLPPVGGVEEADETDDRMSIAALGRILARLRTPPPQNVGDELEEGHEYLELGETDKLQRNPDNPDEVEKIVTYKIRDNVVQQDISALESYVKTFGLGSTAGNAAQNLIYQLQAYRMLDSKIAAHQKSDDLFGSRSMMDVKGKLMGRTLLFGLAATAFIMTGSASAVQFFKTGKLSWAPAMYGLAALLFLRPNKVLNPLFDKDDPMKNDFAEAQVVAQNPTLIDLCTRYGIGGEGWAGVVDGIYNGDHGKIAETAFPTPGAVDEAIEALTNDATVAQSLRRMFNHPSGINGKNDFQRLVYALGAAKSDGAKELAVNSVRSNFFLDTPSYETARAQLQAANARTARS